MAKELMADRDGVIWLDGALVPWREAKVHVLTHTLHYGMGVFEGVRAYKTSQGTAIFRLDEHNKRFFQSAHILNMRLPMDMSTLAEAHAAVIRENGLSEAYIRPMAFLFGIRHLTFMKIHAHQEVEHFKTPARIAA